MHILVKIGFISVSYGQLNYFNILKISNVIDETIVLVLNWYLKMDLGRDFNKIETLTSKHCILKCITVVFLTSLMLEWGEKL